MTVIAVADDHMSPQDFILHLHSTNRENRTCHWGFDPSHWRSYIHLNEAAYFRGREKMAAEVKSALDALDEFKHRFAHPKLKRKHQHQQVRVSEFALL